MPERTQLLKHYNSLSTTCFGHFCLS